MDKLFNWVSVFIGLAGGFLAGILGGWDKWLLALVCFVVIDYITGVIKAVCLKQLSSEIGFHGILKKVLIFCVIAVAVILQGLINDAVPLRDIVVCFYAANEGISLLENISMFIPMPQNLKDVLLQIRDKSGTQEVS